jgi:hypothetical protein
MNDYRSEAGQVARDTRWTVFRFLPIFVFVLIVLGGVGFVLNTGGIIGKTVVERVVFEESYQRSESFKARIATDTASLTEIERQLLNPNLDANTRFNLDAQAAAARVRIQTARSMQ